MRASRRIHLVLAFVAAAAASYAGAAEKKQEQMPDEVRQSLGKTVIFATPGQGNEAVTGSYGKGTDGVMGGAAKGSEIGNIPVEVGQVPINIPIPILREIGMIVGGIKGGTQQQIQDLRDRLTEDLIRAVDQPLNNDALANTVFWSARTAKSVEPKLLDPGAVPPPDTDSILYVSLAEIAINVQGKEAIISTSAVARLERASDGSTIYRATAIYKDRETLGNWAKNDYALWRGYRDFAGHFVGRELSAQLFERIAVDQSLAPEGNAWNARSKTQTPTLAWNYELTGGDAGKFDANKILWDIEIYDEKRPVYAARQVPASSHTVSTPLEKCKTYRWTVRPSFATSDGRKFGSWMRSVHGTDAGNSNDGRAASVAHAYIQDFASLEIGCR